MLNEKKEIEIYAVIKYDWNDDEIKEIINKIVNLKGTQVIEVEKK